MKYPMCLPVENSVVELSAARMRAGVLDVHVVVEMLAIMADKQTIDQALSAFAGKYRMHVVADQAPAQEQRMGGNIGASSLLNAQRGNIESLSMFAFDHIVGNGCVFSRNQLGCAVRQHRAAAQREVFFDDRSLAFICKNQQVARM